MQVMHKLIVLSCLLLVSCSENVQSSMRLKGEKISLSLAKDLEEVHSAQDLKEISLTVKKKIIKLTKLMIESDKKLGKVNKGSGFEGRSHLASDRLLYEIHRLSKDPEIFKVLKDLQRDSLENLDRIEKAKKKSKY